MTATPQRWGKAGQRLDANGRPAPNRIRQARSHRDDALHEAYKRWRAGLVCPSRITQALDLRGLYGPEVDVACKAREPEVDQWEAGERYPTWEQLRALADLTLFSPRFFVLDAPEPLSVADTSLWFRMNEQQQREYSEDRRPVVMRYPRDVLDARPPSPAEMPTCPPPSPPVSR